MQVNEQMTLSVPVSKYGRKHRRLTDPLDEALVVDPYMYGGWEYMWFVAKWVASVNSGVLAE
jgi:hypothetical protein